MYRSASPKFKGALAPGKGTGLAGLYYDSGVADPEELVPVELCPECQPMVVDIVPGSTVLVVALDGAFMVDGERRRAAVLETLGGDA